MNNAYSIIVYIPILRMTLKYDNAIFSKDLESAFEKAKERYNDEFQYILTVYKTP